MPEAQLKDEAAYTDRMMTFIFIRRPMTADRLRRRGMIGAIVALICIGIFPSVMSYLLWNKALTVLPASGAGVFLNLSTVFTAAFTMFSGQPYSAAQVIGGITVFVGVAVANARGLLPKRGGVQVELLPQRETFLR